MDGTREPVQVAVRGEGDNAADAVYHALGAVFVLITADAALASALSEELPDAWASM